jgi:UDP-glucose 4-epimerase
VIDDLSTGRAANLARHAGKPGFTFHKVDLKNFQAVKYAIGKLDPKPAIVYHFAAFASAGIGPGDSESHWANNADATYNLLESLRTSKMDHSGLRIVYSSTGAVYGNATVVPTPEEYGPLKPTTIYAASKMAGEAAISAYCDNCGWASLIFRIANVIGPREQQGVIPDFIRKLRKNPKELEILGDGLESKAYLHVSDLVTGMMIAEAHPFTGTNVYNIGNRDRVRVTEIADIVIEEMGLTPKRVKLNYTGKKAWAGDASLMGLDVSKVAGLGATPARSSKQAVRLAAKELIIGR